MYYKEFTMNEHEDNPNVLVIAGIHGNEIGTIKLAYDLCLLYRLYAIFVPNIHGRNKNRFILTNC